MTTNSDVIAGLEMALAQAETMIERLNGELEILRNSTEGANLTDVLDATDSRVLRQKDNEWN